MGRASVCELERETGWGAGMGGGGVRADRATGALPADTHRDTRTETALARSQREDLDYRGLTV